METDTSARRSEDAPVRVCRGCGKELPPHTGRGRPKRSCDRACESKAYRKDAAARREDALAAAFVLPRGGNDDGPEDALVRGSAQRRELLELAARVQRVAAGYLERIDAVAAHTSDDAGGGEALRLLETSLDALGGRMLRLGRAIRWETLHGDGDEDGGWSPAAAMPARQQAPAAPAGTTLVSPRGGNGGGGEGGADGRIVPRGDEPPALPLPPAGGPQPAPAPSGGVDLTPPRGGEPGDLTPPRGGIQDGRDPVPAPPRGGMEDAAVPTDPAASAARPDPLAAVPVDRRGFGPTTYATPLPEVGPGWEVRGWPDQDSVCLVAHDGRLVGWSEAAVPGRWIAFVGFGLPLTYLVDAQDRPIRHPEARSAARSIALALRQDPART